MIRSVLCVCTGNLCRSPMAQALLAQRLGHVTVASAGTAAPAGQPAAAHAVRILAERNIDIGQHRARAVTLESLQASELILTADAGHVRDILVMMPSLRGRVFRLGHWRDTDIPDPIGGSQADFEECLALIESCVEDWVPRLSAETVDRDG